MSTGIELLTCQDALLHALNEDRSKLLLTLFRMDVSTLEAIIEAAQVLDEEAQFVLEDHLRSTAEEQS